MKNNLAQLIVLTFNSRELFKELLLHSLDLNCENNMTEKFCIDTSILTAHMYELALSCVSFQDRETFILNTEPIDFLNSKNE